MTRCPLPCESSSTPARCSSRALPMLNHWYGDVMHAFGGISPPSPCTQGERGGGEGVECPTPKRESASGATHPLTPNPSPPEYRGRGETIGLLGGGYYDFQPLTV